MRDLFLGSLAAIATSGVSYFTVRYVLGVIFG